MQSIKTKIILSLLCVVISVLSFYEVSSYIETKHRLYLELELSADRQIARLAEGLSLPLWELDETWQTKVVMIEMMKNEVYGIIVTDDQNVIRGKMRNEQWQTMDTTKEIQGDFIYRHRDILHGEEKIGSVSIYLTPKFVEEQLYNEAFNRLIALIVLSVAIILSVATILNQIVTKPLRQILQIIEAIASGDYRNGLTFKQRDEIGSLAVGVVAMKKAIQQREQAILASENDYRILNEHLEQRVAERTHDLELNNQHLQALSLELEKTKDVAESANRAKSVFLANMSHELRTPMNAVLGFSQLMQKDPDLTVSQRDSLNIINNSGQHLLELINDVLDMAKIEAGRIVIEKSNFDLGALIRDTIDMMRQRAEVKDLALYVDQSSKFPRFIHADESKLRQILLNLIGNAIKYTRQGEVRVHLTTEESSDDNLDCLLICSVEDTGIGISEPDLPLIFDTFVQVSNASDQKGTGLGLPITKEYVELMGGTITATSVLGQGSTFTLNLPVMKVLPSEVPTLSVSKELQVVSLKAGQPLYRVLIVEDQLENRLLLRQLLATVGFDIYEAVNGLEAVKQFQTVQPHFIWMDNRMPVMNGIEATRQIRALPNGQDVKIVAVTASVFLDQRQELVAAGVNDIINKPYRFAEIFDSMTKQLGVKFVYETADETAVDEADRIDVNAIRNLPTEWIDALREAAISLDVEHCSGLIEQIASVEATLAEQLLERVQQFDFETLSDWLK
jgi:signal transduction histidine kinase/DNA-binding response OmpR family regulator